MLRNKGERISENVYNSILLNSVPEAYHIMINILQSQEQLVPTIIINQLLEESRKMGDTTSENSEKMKQALLSNTTKPERREINEKDNGSKTGAKTGLRCDFCNKNGHEEQTC